MKKTLACAGGKHGECYGTRYKTRPWDMTVLGPCECTCHSSDLRESAMLDARAEAMEREGE